MSFGWFGEFVISEVSKERHLVISGFRCDMKEICLFVILRAKDW
jgi:hypothetical protein